MIKKLLKDQFLKMIRPFVFIFGFNCLQMDKKNHAGLRLLVGNSVLGHDQAKKFSKFHHPYFPPSYIKGTLFFLEWYRVKIIRLSVGREFRVTSFLSVLDFVQAVNDKTRGRPTGEQSPLCSFQHWIHTFHFHKTFISVCQKQKTKKHTFPYKWNWKKHTKSNGWFRV